MRDTTTHRTFSWLVLVEMGCILLLSTTVCDAESPAEDNESEKCRVIINYDEFNLFRYQLRWLAAKLGRDPEPAEANEMLEHIVDQHAQAKVDRLVQCVFSLPWGVSTAGFETFNRAPNRGWIEMVPG